MKKMLLLALKFLFWVCCAGCMFWFAGALFAPTFEVSFERFAKACIALVSMGVLMRLEDHLRQR